MILSQVVQSSATQHDPSGRGELELAQTFGRGTMSGRGKGDLMSRPCTGEYSGTTQLCKPLNSRPATRPC